MTDIITVEKALAQYFASVLELTVDETVFRGSVPSAKCNGIGVIISSGNNGNDSSPDKTACQLLGRYTDRDQALTIMQKLDNLLPVYGATVNIDNTNVNLTIIKRGNPGIYPSSQNGHNTTGLAANLIVIVSS